MLGRHLQIGRAGFRCHNRAGSLGAGSLGAGRRRWRRCGCRRRDRLPRRIPRRLRLYPGGLRLPYFPGYPPPPRSLGLWRGIRGCGRGRSGRRRGVHSAFICAGDRAGHDPLSRIAPDQVAHREEHSAQRHHYEEKADELPVPKYKFFFAVCLRHDCGLPASFTRWPSRLELESRKCPSELRISIGSGNTIVVFFSVPISTSVCK